MVQGAARKKHLEKLATETNPRYLKFKEPFGNNAPEPSGLGMDVAFMTKAGKAPIGILRNIAILNR